jgi:hypothetical protein
MNDLTPLQNLVSKAWNSYPDEVFIEMVELLDDPEFYQDCILEELTDEECVSVLNRLLSMFRDWNTI